MPGWDFFPAGVIKHSGKNNYLICLKLSEPNPLGGILVGIARRVAIRVVLLKTNLYKSATEVDR